MGILRSNRADSGCIFFMEYSGGIFYGKMFIEAIGANDASVSLAMGSLVAVILSFIYYIMRGTMSFNECMNCISAGSKAMGLQS